MELENRYISIKISDFQEAAKVDPEIKSMLSDVLDSVEKYRTARGKSNLKCVVIEHDWPEYGPAVALLGKRVDGSIRSADALAASLEAYTEEDLKRGTPIKASERMSSDWYFEDGSWKVYSGHSIEDPGFPCMLRWLRPYHLVTKDGVSTYERG